MKKVSIKIDPNNLLASISLNGTSPSLLNAIKILFAGLYDDAFFSEDLIKVGWHALKKLLPQLAFLIKQEKAKLELDEFTQILFNEYVSDKKSIKKASEGVLIEEGEINATLQAIGFGRSLTKEQCRDASKLLRLKHGANFSVPGAGKTTVLLAIHYILKSHGIVNKLLVVSPINAFISWTDEVKAILSVDAARMTTEMLREPGRLSSIDADIILVNYEKVRRDIDGLIPILLSNRFHIVLDESHRIKSGSNNLSYNQIISVSDLARRRDILSGTPMPQSYKDLEPQFDFLWANDNVVPNVDSIKEDKEKIKIISESIEPLFVRTTKKELELGPLIPLYNRIEMGPVQKELYRLFKSEAARRLSGMDKVSVLNFRRIGKSVIRLIQAASNPLLLSDKQDYSEDSLPVPKDETFWELLQEFYKYEKAAKINTLTERLSNLITEHNDTKVLIWSSFIKNIKLLERILAKYNPVSIYGAIPSGSDEDEGTRERQIRDFHSDSTCRVMLANPQACGEGISLHKACHYAIYFDRTFNAAYYLQSIDRIHRLGLDKRIETKVEILISKGTIDEILVDRINDKIKNMGRILDDKYLESLAYDPLDIPLDNESGIDDFDFDLIKKHIYGS